MKKVIAIGALGGSGTRAIAQILIDAGIYMGDYLNSPRDNLIFTRLFKNTEFRRNAGQTEIRQRLAVFEEYMETDRLSFSSARILLNTTIDGLGLPERAGFHGRVLRKLLGPGTHRASWGWKEPNTHIYLDEIDAYFDNLKYMHVIRHGLDMAFSNNKMQLFNWGPRYGIELAADMPEEEKSYKQLEYWIRTTRDIMEKSKTLRGDFLMINHSRLCANPREQVDRILTFLDMKMGDDRRQQLYSIPRTPGTLDRYRKHDLGIFDQRQIDFVKDMGFEVKV
jgi:hypothetical protein